MAMLRILFGVAIVLVSAPADAQGATPGCHAVPKECTVCCGACDKEKVVERLSSKLF
jgi:hypothetical protein